VSFAVDPAALRTAADQYAAHADQLEAADRYHDQYSQFDWTEAGLVLRVHPAHRELIDVLHTHLRKAADAIRTCADELRDAADRYAHADRASASRWDSLVPTPWPSDTDPAARP
jgi:uncharacterized protein YukE